MLLPQSHNPPRKQQPSVQEELQLFGNKLDEDEGGSRLCKSKRKSFGSEIGCDSYIARFRCFCSISTCDSESLHFLPSSHTEGAHLIQEAPHPPVLSQPCVPLMRRNLLKILKVYENFVSQLLYQNKVTKQTTKFHPCF